MKISPCFLAAALWPLTPILAATHHVDSVAQLQSRIDAAVAGDTIVVKNGAYTTNAPLVVNRAGTAAQPITIAAESIGGVEIRGTHGFNVASPAAHIVIRGFVLAHASGKLAIGGGTSHVRFTRNTIRCVGEGPYLTVTGDHAEIDYNEFRDKRTLGNMINITGTGSQVARGLHIHHNHFHDFTNAGGNGAETIRFGLSGLSMSTGGGVVEHNLFERCRGENELISNKSGGNTYRYNTFIDSPGTQLTLRHGNDCQVYGNYFRNTDGLRIFGDRHWVFSNYFEGNSLGINLGNGGAEVADGAPLTSHDRPDNCVIAFNTLVNNRTHYAMTRRATNALGATSTTFANNVLVGGDVAAKIEGPNAGALWSGNIVWNVKSTGDLPADGVSAVDPQLVADERGIFRPRAGSPAIDAAAGGYPAVVVDLDGQPRTIAKDKGADEISNAPVKARMLTPAEVGPLAK